MTALESRGAERGLRLPLEALVFAVGLSTLGAEIAAARLMAPFFGSSTVIWANTIAVVLLALSAGYKLGGMLADRRPSTHALCVCVLVGSGLLAVVPFIAYPFLSLSVDAFDTVSVGAFAASLFGTLVLVAVPLLLLGTVSPWATRIKLATVEEAGSVLGRLYAVSTIGSLVGVFFVALWAIEAIGTQRTFLVLAALPAAVAAAGLSARAALVPVAIVAALALPPGTTKPSDDALVLYERETPYQYARVVQMDDGSRRLELNEGQAIHSLWKPGTVLTGGYWDGFLVLPFAGGADRPPKRIAALGTAGGTVPRAYAEYYPDTIVDAVDIDPELFKIGHRYFGLEARPQLREFTQDARPFLRQTAERYDAIFVDAYRQPYIPFYLTTTEFFALARERLNPGGSVIVNIGHPNDSPALEEAMSATMGTVFKHVARDPIRPQNSLVMASDVPLSAAAIANAPVPAGLRTLAQDSAARFEGPLRGGNVFTDDRAPVEWLIDASIVAYAAEDKRMSAAVVPAASRWGFVEAVKFVSGVTVLGAELAAARLIAPAFGASTVVWANTIAIVLVALAAGYWLGGRLADRHPTERAMARGALLGAAMVALIPFLAVPLLAVTEDSLGEFSGSLLVQLVLVAPPVLVLGALAPWAIRLRVTAVASAGDITGRLYALSTAGGLVGNFAAALFLIPWVGTRWTFLICAALLAVVVLPKAWSSSKPA